MFFIDLRHYKKITIFILSTALISLIFTHKMESNYMVSSVSHSVRLLPIYKVDTTEQAVAISFDASWGAEYTEKILDTLDKHHVKTTFFLVNIWLEEYPEVAWEIMLRGHEIGMHSTSHPDFRTLSKAQMEKELKENVQMIKEITGYSPTIFRPPFGAYNNQVIEMTKSLGYQTVQWSIDSLDWKDLSAAEIEKRVMKNIGPGDIVLFHNNGLHTAEALEPILCRLEEKGLSVVPVSDLLLQGDWYIDYAGVQRSK